MINDIKTILKNELTDDVIKALDIVDSILMHSSTRKSDFLLVKNRITYLRDEKSRGTLSFDEIQKTNNQIAESFFHFVDRLNIDDFDILRANQLLSLKGKNNGKGKQISEGAISFEKLRTSSKPEIYEIIEFYKYNLNKGRLDDEIYFNLGLCYLHLKLFDLSVKYFEKSLELAPDNSDYHYYLALASLRGKRPYTLMPNDIRNVEKYLYSAIELDSRQAKYSLLSIIIKYDYYHLNGLTVPQPSVQDLIDSLGNKTIDPNEIHRLKESFPISDSKLNQFINQF